MATQPAHDRLEATPFWQVQIVFDPDGAGADFAYTIGLHTRGFPELHIWARPNLGEDPGADWILSTRDRGAVLNELAGMLVEGRLGVGSELTREYDGGHTRVTYRIDPPGDREELEAYGVPEGVAVLPVRWALHRSPEGTLRPLTVQAAQAAARLYDELTSGPPGSRRAPRGWRLPTTPRFDPDQPFGPMTPVVLARAAELWQADEDTVIALLRVAAEVSVHYSLSYATTVASAVARAHGRSAALAELHDQVHELVEALTTAPAAQRRWRSISRAFAAGWWTELDGAGRKNAERRLADLLHDVTLSCLAVEAVGDVADEKLLLEGRGSWVRGVARQALLSAPEWEASAEVLAAIGGLMSSLDAQGLMAMARLHAFAMTGRVKEAETYPDLCYQLLSWATVSAAVYPQRMLDALPGWTAPRDAVPGVSVVAPLELQTWATCLAAAMTHRARLSADDIRTLTLLYEEDLPQIATVLNAPLSRPPTRG